MGAMVTLADALQPGRLLHGANHLVHGHQRHRGQGKRAVLVPVRVRECVGEDEIKGEGVCGSEEKEEILR